MADPIRNPIIKGFYPDPSICRAGDDYYIATSSFSFFPGIPIFHSRDLVHWEQIGHVFDDPEVLRLDGDVLSGGLFAPTLRYRDGTFYCIVQNASEGRGCFEDLALLATAKDPAGPWQAQWIHGTGGDPSLFFDDDGKLYTTFSYLTVGRQDVVDHGIYLRELDAKTFAPVGVMGYLWDGALKGSAYPEASHLFKRNGWYYLMIAEGGTEYYHSVTLARSRKIDGIYEPCPHNPIMTHRHLSRLHPICNVGHADYVETPDGQCYVVLLGSRLNGGYHKNLGRETYLAPVIWENDWPIISPETGKIELEYPAPALPQTVFREVPAKDDFTQDRLALQWNFIGSPVTPFYRIADSNLYLRTIAAPIHPEKPPFGGPPFGDVPPLVPKCISFVGRRQQDYYFTVTIKMHFCPIDRDFAGMVVIQDNYNQLRLELAKEHGAALVRVVRNKQSHEGFSPDMTYEETVLGTMAMEDGDVYLQLKAAGQDFTFLAGKEKQSLKVIAAHVDASFLGLQTFVGTYIGMFATGDGADVPNEAAFDYFTYLPEE